jgi:hypothetical protein
MTAATSEPIHLGAVSITSVPSAEGHGESEGASGRPAQRGGPRPSANTTGDDWAVRLSSCAFAHGQLDLTDPPAVHIPGPRDIVTPTEALRFANATHEAAITAHWVRRHDHNTSAAVARGSGQVRLGSSVDRARSWWCGATTSA